MDGLLSELGARNIQVSLVGGTDLDVVAPDAEWDTGLESYLLQFKPKIVDELRKDKGQKTAENKADIADPAKPATTATIATNATRGGAHVATALLQSATTGEGSDTAHFTFQDDRRLGESTLGPFLDRAAVACTISELTSVLVEFSQTRWTLIQKSRMSTEVTPVALKLIAAENLDKHRVLEDLAALCWAKPRNVNPTTARPVKLLPICKQADGRLPVALDTASRQAGKAALEKVFHLPAPLADELRAVYIDRFINRADIWFKQWIDNSGRCSYACQKPEMDTKGGSFIFEPVTSALVARHLAGEITCAWTAINESLCSKWLCFDSDTNNGDLGRLAAFLRKHGWQVITEGRRPGRDGHLWLLFDKPVPTEHLIVLGDAMMRLAGVSGLERFPKSSTGLSQVRGPLGINLKPEANGIRSWFDDVRHDINAQLRWLVEQPLNRFDDAIKLADERRPKAPPAIKRQFSGLSTDRINILDYVECRRLGKELVAQCPLCALEGHDRHRDNLRINEEGNTFCCVFGGPGKVHKAGDIRRTLLTNRSGAA